MKEIICPLDGRLLDNDSARTRRASDYFGRSIRHSWVHLSSQAEKGGVKGGRNIVHDTRFRDYQRTKRASHCGKGRTGGFSSFTACGLLR